MAVQDSPIVEGQETCKYLLNQSTYQQQRGKFHWHLLSKQSPVGGHYIMMGLVLSSVSKLAVFQASQRFPHDHVNKYPLYSYMHIC